MLSRQELFDFVITNGGFRKVKPEDLVEHFEKSSQISFEVDERSAWTIEFKWFLVKARQRWEKAGRHLERFKSDNFAWLTEAPGKERVRPAEARTASTPGCSSGRRAIPFAHKASTSKRKETDSLVRHSADKLLHAARRRSRSEGRKDLSFVLKNSTSSPNRPTKVRRLLERPTQVPKMYTPEQALNVFIDGGFTKASWQLVRSSAKGQHADIYPAYNRIRAAKAECYPDEVVVESSRAEVSLQSLLDHTARRLVRLQEDVIRQAAGDKEEIQLELISKWGFDGSTGHSFYKQSDIADPKNDGQALVTSLVPLQMRSSSEIIWQNTTPSSTRFCRPMKIEYCKETSEKSRMESEYWKGQIQQLTEISVPLTGVTVTVAYRMQLTMVDGKAINAITDTSSQQRCALCGATPKVMNDLHHVTQLEVTSEHLQLGLSSLHLWIRLFECILHISYRLELRKWKIHKEDKERFNRRKENVKKNMWEKMNLHVDQPRVGGSGTSNDGNTARRAFSQEELFAEATGVHQGLIHRFAVILQTLASGYAVDIQRLQNYCTETAELYVEQYEWYPMPASLHKVLIHGADVTESLILPVGMMSEEAQEARNKDVRAYRLRHARKDSRVHTMADQMGYLLVTSDPVVSSSSVRRYNKRAASRQALLSEAVALLSSSTGIQQDQESGDSDC